MSANMNGLHPYVREKAEQLLKNANARLKNYKMGITEAYRSKAEQDALYAKGRTAPGSIVTHAKGGQSMHNYGLAIDFALFTPDGKKAFWDTKVDSDKDGKADWMEVVEEAKKLGFEWGGDWKGFKDYPHFQMLGGLTESQVRAGKTPNFGSASKPSTPKAKSYLEKGDKGSDVKELQEKLNKFGYKLVADGIFGDLTEKAVRDFQKKYKLEVDGVAGKLTFAKLDSEIKKKNDSKKTPAKSTGIKSIGKIKIVGVSNAAIVMDGPDRNKAKNIGTIGKGKLVNISGSVKGKNNPNGYWEVIYDGKRAYISGQFGELQ